MRRALVGAVILVFTAQPVLATDLLKAAEKAAKAEAVRLAQEPAANQVWGMHPAYFWVGVGLVSTGAATSLYALALKEDVCSGWDEYYFGECSDAGLDAVAILYAGMAAAGVAVWIVGKSKGRAAASRTMLQPRRGGVMLSHQFRF